MSEFETLPGIVKAKDSALAGSTRIKKGDAYWDTDPLVIASPGAFEPYVLEIHSTVSPPELELEIDDEPEPIDDSARPKGNASVAEWAAYVGSFGEDLNAEFLNGLKRDDLIAMADDFEAAAAAEAAADQD